MNDFMVVAMNNIKDLFQDNPRLQEGVDHIQTIVKPMFKLYKDLPLSADEKYHTKDSVLKKPGVAIPNEGRSCCIAEKACCCFSKESFKTF